jgi:hypothetical protein
MICTGREKVNRGEVKKRRKEESRNALEIHQETNSM